ncbi:MAG TPA: tRNA pseudouridine(55) synthase TruB [Rhodospirillaceae bacterium]|jgi:tRNA pseudouridine55 synthase|nr:tRNA pseudouridine(55) synthase TruB [Alphaproteobacteria bacterium]HBH26567.1 tRNA pseudouridine(55) synthase TruB [Rhodospirillaceae bacterium]
MRRRKHRGKPITGWLALDKPAGWTSVQAMARARALLGAAKAGHAGTLDPLATGCLPIALGHATKRIARVQDQPKTYLFTVRWGVSTTTDDAEGEVMATSATRPATEDIRALLPRYTGEIDQLPPQFSALKVEGQRAYALARAGQEVALEPRKVMIHSLDLLAARPDEADFGAITGKGAYVRSLARDMGANLGCGGHVTALRRERVGPFGPEEMISLDTLAEMGQSAALPGGAVLPLSFVLDDIPAEDGTIDP